MSLHDLCLLAHIEAGQLASASPFLAWLPVSLMPLDIKQPQLITFNLPPPASLPLSLHC